jgi:hypothetical protein
MIYGNHPIPGERLISVRRATFRRPTFTTDARKYRTAFLACTFSYRLLKFLPSSGNGTFFPISSQLRE